MNIEGLHRNFVDIKCTVPRKKSCVLQIPEPKGDILKPVVVHMILPHVTDAVHEAIRISVCLTGFWYNLPLIFLHYSPLGWKCLFYAVVYWLCSMCLSTV